MMSPAQDYEGRTLDLNERFVKRPSATPFLAVTGDSMEPEIEMFRGEFTGLNGSADFYADSIEALREEGRTSLRTCLEVCQEKGIEPTKSYSGKFQVRLPEELHRDAVDAHAIQHEISA